MTATRCVICKEPCGDAAHNELFPFCSRRCQLVDLGRWLDGDYRIPGQHADVSDPDTPDSGDGQSLS